MVELELDDRMIGAIVVVALAAFWYYRKTQNEMTDCDKKLGETQTKLESAKEQCAVIKDELSSCNVNHSASKAENAKLSERLAWIGSQADLLKSEIEKVQEHLEVVE